MAREWRFIDAMSVSRQVHATPPTWELLIALSSDPQGVLMAEELFRTHMANMGAWGVHEEGLFPVWSSVDLHDFSECLPNELPLSYGAYILPDDIPVHLLKNLVREAYGDCWVPYEDYSGYNENSILARKFGAQASLKFWEFLDHMSLETLYDRLYSLSPLRRWDPEIILSNFAESIVQGIEIFTTLEFFANDLGAERITEAALQAALSVDESYSHYGESWRKGLRGRGLIGRLFSELPNPAAAFFGPQGLYSRGYVPTRYYENYDSNGQVLMGPAAINVTPQECRLALDGGDMEDFFFAPSRRKLFDLKVENFDFRDGGRIVSRLHDANLDFLGELVRKSEDDLLKIKGFGQRGKKNLRTLKGFLSDFGLHLGMDVGDWVPPGG